jgi:hypothetical protein
MDNLVGVSDGWSSRVCDGWGTMDNLARVSDGWGSSVSHSWSSGIRDGWDSSMDDLARVSVSGRVDEWRACVGQRWNSIVNDSSLLTSRSGLSFSNSLEVLGLSGNDLRGIRWSNENGGWSNWEGVAGYSVSIVISDVVGGQLLSFG